MTSAPILARGSVAQCRETLIDDLIRVADSGEMVSLLAAPGAGATQVLKTLFDRCFERGGEAVPFYFDLRTNETSVELAERFMLELARQVAAFLSHDTALITSSADVFELEKLVHDPAFAWLPQLIERLRFASPSDPGALAACFAAPLMARRSGLTLIPILDSVDALAEFAGQAFVEQLFETYRRSGIAAVFGGRRRAIYPFARRRSFKLDRLSWQDASSAFGEIVGALGVEISDTVRDLAAVHLASDLKAMEAVALAAADAGIALTSFDRFARVYSDDLFGGRISRSLAAIFERAFADDEVRSSAIEILNTSLNRGDAFIPLRELTEAWPFAHDVLYRGLDALHREEILSIQGSSISLTGTDRTARDYIAAADGLRRGAVSRVRLLVGAMERTRGSAPGIMSTAYLTAASLDLKKSLEGFRGAAIPRQAIDYAAFKTGLKGSDDAGLHEAVRGLEPDIRLPEIVFASTASSFAPVASQFDRTVIGVGFAGDDLTAWIAAEISSKLEADASAAGGWCDQLSDLAETCGFGNYQIWLIAPEGFDDEASRLLNERGAYGSSKKQFELISNLLALGEQIDVPDTEVYEVDLPMGPDSEIIAAHTLEEIAHRHDFPPRAINQIKTALVEACINAAEHSASPDRRIRQRFEVDDKKIRITVSNRGVRLLGKTIPEAGEIGETRRGWGIKLMRSLMDDVELAETEDGTILTMTKYLPAVESGDPASS